MTTPATDKPLRDRLRALADYAGRFDGGDGVDFDVPGGTGDPFAPHAWNALAGDFVKMAYDRGWVLQDFDWPKWSKTAECRALRENPEALDGASPEMLAKFLTAVIRADRFADGALAGVQHSGHLQRVCERAAVLLRGLEDAGSSTGGKT